MPQTNSGFVFATSSEFVFFLTDAEAEEQTTLDKPNDLEGGDPNVLEMALNSAALEMLLYLSRYAVTAIEHNTLLKRINSYIANWALEIYGIRDAQERRYEWAIATLELIRNGAPLFDAAGAIVPALTEATADVTGGYDSRSYTGDRGSSVNGAVVPAFQSSPLGIPMRDRYRRIATEAERPYWGGDR